MKIEDRLIEVTFTNGEVWEIPIKEIALNRAANYASEFSSLLERL